MDSEFALKMVIFDDLIPFTPFQIVNADLLCDDECNTVGLHYAG